MGGFITSLTSNLFELKSTKGTEKILSHSEFLYKGYRVKG